MNIRCFARAITVSLAVLSLVGLADARGQAVHGRAANAEVQGQSDDTKLPSSAPVESDASRTAATAALQDDATLLGQLVRANMTSGQRYTVSITMKNTGTTTWAAGEGYALGSQNPGNNYTWGVARVSPGTSVAPGQSYTFTFQVAAPGPGSYDMQWQLLKENVRWFGPITSTPVIVTPPGGPIETVTYIHTDGLGSPVARTDADGRLISRTRYEPYGATADGVEPTTGFTGHVNDVDTGLVYMQQRYYDPIVGRFLSVDPVSADANSGSSFNRYAYANNSPYRYIDPDGRFGAQDCANMGGNCTNYGGGNNSVSRSFMSMSATAKAGAVLGGFAGASAAVGCDVISAGTCAPANPAIATGGALGGAALGAVTGGVIDRAWSQLSRLIEKATESGPLETQYALIAARDGPYPSVRGGLVNLKEGEVWKYGTTADPAGRYSRSTLDNLNLKMIEQTVGTRYQVLTVEKMMIIQYAISNGDLPPGNKIFK